MSCLHTALTQSVSQEDLRNGQLLLDDIRALSSLNAILFDHLRASLVPGGAACALPRNTRIQSGKQVQSDGRVLELYMGILFHCMGFRVLSCGGGPADGGVDVKVEVNRGEIIAIQCKQYSRAVVGYNMGLQLIGAMYTTNAKVGVLITPSTASQEVKALSKSMRDIRHGELKLHVWEGDDLVRLLGKWSADILDTRAALMDDVLGNAELCRRITASQPHGYCIRHAISLPRQEGECDKHCAPLPLPPPLHPHRPTPLLSPIALTPSLSVHHSTSSPSPTTPSTTSSPSTPFPLIIAPLQSNSASVDSCAYIDGDYFEVLESISDEEDTGPSIHQASANCRSLNTSVSRSPSRRPQSNRSLQCATPRQQTAVLWTTEEEEELQRCVVEVGEGRWTDILERSELLRTNGKNAIKIRDKWKNMRKRQLRVCTPVRYNR